MIKNRMFTALAALSLALGIGANTAIYSFMDSILLRSLPVSDPASLVVVKWQSKPSTFTASNDFVMHSIDGTYLPRRVRASPRPSSRFRRSSACSEASAPVLSSLFAHKPAGRVNVMIKGEAELAQGEYVSGDFFRGLAVSPAAGRLILRRRRSRRRRAGRGPEPGLQRAALRRCRQRHRAADSRSTTCRSPWSG